MMVHLVLLLMGCSLAWVLSWVLNRVTGLVVVRLGDRVLWVLCLMFVVLIWGLRLVEMCRCRLRLLVILRMVMDCVVLLLE